MTPEISVPGPDLAKPFAGWLGKAQSADDEIGLPAVRRMAAMLDLEPMAFEHGSEVPPHWYSMFFTPNARRSQIGPDGHPRKGDFLPPIPLPRRMFVGRTVDFPGALRVGDHAHKRSEIVGIEHKQGRSGALVFVTVRHSISVAGQTQIVEQQEVVYRDAASGQQPAQPAAPVPEGGAWSLEHEMDPVLVFRYSALTWNGHRVHYDADYARREEGYPGCVMNGALTLHLVIEEVLRRAGGRKLLGLSAKLVKPLFVGGRLTVSGPPVHGHNAEAWASDEQGALAARCRFRFEAAP